jgi:hypothetical protein
VLFDAPAPAPPAAPAPPPSIVERARNVVTVYAPKAERIIDAPVYDTAAILGVDVIWLGGVLIALKLIGMGVWWEFFRGKDGKCSCPLPHSA